MRGTYFYLFDFFNSILLLSSWGIGIVDSYREPSQNNCFNDIGSGVGACVLRKNRLFSKHKICAVSNQRNLNFLAKCFLSKITFFWKKKYSYLRKIEILTSNSFPLRPHGLRALGGLDLSTGPNYCIFDVSNERSLVNSQKIIFGPKKKPWF